MISRHLPKGTSLRSLLMELLVADHAENVPKDAGEAKVGLRFGSGGPCFLLHAVGHRLTVTETERIEPAPLLLDIEESTAQLFLDDWLGPQRFAPSFEPRGIASITDPRLIAAVSAVPGMISMTLDDFHQGRGATLVVAAGPDASLYDDPDVTLHIKLPAFLQILSGTLGPDEAIVDGHVSLKGKKLVAMHLALAIVPYLPPRVR